METHEVESLSRARIQIARAIGGGNTVDDVIAGVAVAPKGRAVIVGEPILAHGIDADESLVRRRHAQERPRLSVQSAIRRIAADSRIAPLAGLIRGEAHAPHVGPIKKTRRGVAAPRGRFERQRHRHVGKRVGVGRAARQLLLEDVIARHFFRGHGRRRRRRQPRRRCAAERSLNRLPERRAKAIALPLILGKLDEQHSDRPALMVAPAGHAARPAMYEQAVLDRDAKGGGDVGVVRRTADKTRTMRPVHFRDRRARKHRAIVIEEHLLELRHVPHRGKYAAIRRRVLDLKLRVEPIDEPADAALLLKQRRHPARIRRARPIGAVVHAERSEDPLLHEIRIGLSRHHVDQSSEHKVARARVVLAGPRLKQQLGAGDSLDDVRGFL